MVNAYARFGGPPELFACMARRACALAPRLAAHDVANLANGYARVMLRPVRALAHIAERAVAVRGGMGPQGVANVVNAYSKLAVVHRGLLRSMAERALAVHDLRSGELLFEASVEEHVTGQPVVEDGRVVITTDGGRVHMVDTGHRDGATWHMWGHPGFGGR